MQNISYFIPAYNCASTVKESVESIMFGNFVQGDELIIVNDGSNDSTGSVLEELKARYPKMITILEHTTNLGGGCARNTAVENAKHNLLFCVDSDNILAPNTVSKLKEFMVNSSSDAASFQEIHFFIGTKSNVTHKWSFKSSYTTLGDMLVDHVNPPASGNYLFTRDSWLNAGGYPTFAGALDAWGFGLRQLASGCKMAVMPNSYYYHRYGYESYWVRESRKNTMSEIAAQLLMPYLDLIDNEDAAYILSPAGKTCWFINLKFRPIRLKNK